MIHDVLRVLANWSATSRGAEAVRVESPHSFSGAAVWRVEAAGATYALRQWQAGMNARQLQGIHDFQIRIAAIGPPVIPRLQQTLAGATAAVQDLRLWELSTWQPGTADYWQNPTLGRLDAAMHTLAAVHNAAEMRPALEPGKLLALDRAVPAPWRGSWSVQRRLKRLESIASGELMDSENRVQSAIAGDERDVALESIALVARLAPLELVKARHWSKVDLPLQSRLGDVHHDHVLFTGDEVTGIVDFGAADYDSPAGDVARLLGSLVGDDEALRQRGLAAYQEVHPLSSDEVAAVDFFDSSGTLIAAANWASWLWGDSQKRIARLATCGAVDRQRQLLARLRSLAERGS